MLWDPIRFHETCPSSDGACAMVLANEGAAKQAPQQPAPGLGGATRSEPIMSPGRDEATPRAGRACAADVYRQAGVTNPRQEIDVAEVYVPFSWYEPMWLENLGFADENAGWRVGLEGAPPVRG